MALFKTFGMQNGDILIFFLRSFRKVRFGKMQFLKDGVQTVVSPRAKLPQFGTIAEAKCKGLDQLYGQGNNLCPQRKELESNVE